MGNIDLEQDFLLQNFCDAQYAFDEDLSKLQKKADADIAKAMKKGSEIDKTEDKILDISREKREIYLHKIQDSPCLFLNIKEVEKSNQNLEEERNHFIKMWNITYESGTTGVELEKQTRKKKKIEK